MSSQDVLCTIRPVPSLRVTINSIANKPTANLTVDVFQERQRGRMTPLFPLKVGLNHGKDIVVVRDPLVQF